MQCVSVTTPFGRRPAELAQIRRQIARTEVAPSKPVDKWKTYRDICEARAQLGLQAGPLTILNALLSFYPHDDLDEDCGLIVFPSNAQLSLRAHGMPARSLRRSIAALVEAGIIERNDSPNGKRYAHRGRGGEVECAFGFSLAPVLSRSREFAQLAQTVAEERRRLRQLKDELTVCRRDVRKLIEAGIDSLGEAELGIVEESYASIVGRFPRVWSSAAVADLLDEMQMLRDEVINLLDLRQESAGMSANGGQCGRDIQNSNPESLGEFEGCSEKEQVALTRSGVGTDAMPLKAFPLAMVLRACPQIGDYGPGGMVSDWRGLMAAAVVVRSMLGVSPSAYQDACEVMGQECAAIVMACVLERAGHIHSAGGYLRRLTDKARRREFSLGPMLRALKGPDHRRVLCSEGTAAHKANDLSG